MLTKSRKLTLLNQSEADIISSGVIILFPDEFYPGLANMAGMTGGFLALSLFRGDDDFNNLPEEVREAIDRHRDEFANEEEMRAFAQRMMKKR